MNVMLAGAALVAAASLSASGIAVAQGAEEVNVQTKRVVSTVTGRTPNDVPVVDLSLSYGVKAADLDLASSAGTAQLARRVEAAALAACREISRQYPDARPGDSECARAAADEAMARLRARSGAAQKTLATN